MLVRPAEPEHFDDVTRSLVSGKIERNATHSGSICDAIITIAPGNITFPILQTHCGPGVVVTDDECLRAMGLAFSRLKIVVEPGGAAALAATLFHPDQFRQRRPRAIRPRLGDPMTEFTIASFNVKNLIEADHEY